MAGEGWEDSKGVLKPHHQPSINHDYFIVKKSRSFNGLSLIFCVYNDSITALKLLYIGSILLPERVVFGSYLALLYLVLHQ